MQWRIQDLQTGASIEAPKAPSEGGGFGEGVSPSSMATFSAFWALAHVARGPWLTLAPL